jgi:23S rRNA (cytidine2498-2'-O)-methyltransferase
LAEDFELRSVFARSYFFSLGKAGGASAQELAGEVWKLAGGRRFERLHVWPRDASEPGYRGYEPGTTEQSRAAREALLSAAADRQELPGDFALRAAEARPGEPVLDCTLVEPNEWWVGWHRARSVTSRWPGGLFDHPLPPEAISRAYLKVQEALCWSRLPVRAGEEFVELGCAPGGSSQALLERGLRVIGVDPALVDPRVAEHPAFTHLRKRAADVRRREFRSTRWLAADMNVAPQYTLDAVEAIVTHRQANVLGLLLTLKLLDWDLASEVDSWLARVRGWGYADVRARQLHHNRQEICVAALRARSLRRRKG